MFISSKLSGATCGGFSQITPQIKADWIYLWIWKEQTVPFMTVYHNLATSDWFIKTLCTKIVKTPATGIITKIMNFLKFYFTISNASEKSYRAGYWKHNIDFHVPNVTLTLLRWTFWWKILDKFKFDNTFSNIIDSLCHCHTVPGGKEFYLSHFASNQVFVHILPTRRSHRYTTALKY